MARADGKGQSKIIRERSRQRKERCDLRSSENTDSFLCVSRLSSYPEEGRGDFELTAGRVF